MDDSEEDTGTYRVKIDEFADCAIPGSGTHTCDVRIEAEDEKTLQKLKEKNRWSMESSIGKIAREVFYGQKAYFY